MEQIPQPKLEKIEKPELGPRFWDLGPYVWNRKCNRPEIFTWVSPYGPLTDCKVSTLSADPNSRYLIFNQNWDWYSALIFGIKERRWWKTIGPLGKEELSNFQKIKTDFNLPYWLLRYEPSKKGSFFRKIDLFWAISREPDFCQTCGFQQNEPTFAL